ncbi:MAG: hypothetical protein KF800_13755 [Lysobacter sp.]|nr:hypothetical protein [Lysobacter sp.]
MEEDEKLSAGFVIMNPLTGRPVEKTPGGMPLKDVVFQSKEELNSFVKEHWNNPVILTDGDDLLLPE